MVVLLLKASEHDWRASAWWLERRWPERWALRASSASPRVRQDSEAWTSRR
jgi:hypothetical protein